MPTRSVSRCAKGIAVADDWRPNDRAGFNRAVARRVQQDARSAYASGLESIGRWIEPGLPRGQFLHSCRSRTSGATRCTCRT